jgi:hypothetical protein
LDEVLARLWDVGQIRLAQRNTGYPLYIVAKEVRGLDDIDALAADVCSAVKRRGEQFVPPVTAYLSRSVSVAQGARIVEYLKQASAPVGAVGSGSLTLGSPAHLTMLVELAEEQQRQGNRP